MWNKEWVSVILQNPVFWINPSLRQHHTTLRVRYPRKCVCHQFYFNLFLVFRLCLLFDATKQKNDDSEGMEALQAYSSVLKIGCMRLPKHSCLSVTFLAGMQVEWVLITWNLSTEVILILYQDMALQGRKKLF